MGVSCNHHNVNYWVMYTYLQMVPHFNNSWTDSVARLWNLSKKTRLSGKRGHTYPST